MSPAAAASAPAPERRDRVMCPPPVLTDVTMAPGDDITLEVAREAWQQVQSGSKTPESALLHLRVVEHAFPGLEDRFALTRGKLLLEAGRPEEAYDAYVRATKSIDARVKIQAQVGKVRSLVRAADPLAHRALNRLLKRYPQLPQSLELKYGLARSYEERGRLRKAGLLYRKIDEWNPYTDWAKRARTRLDVLEEKGTHIWPLPDKRRVDRAERVVRSGPLRQARDAVHRLLEDEGLHPRLRARVSLLAARIAEMEGRWKAAHEYLRQAKGGALPRGVSRGHVRRELKKMEDTLGSREREDAMERVSRLRGWRPYHKLPYARLLNILRAAAPAGLEEVSGKVLQALVDKKAPAKIRLRAALMSAGAAPDDKLVALLEGVRDHKRLGTKARYHYARALERLGRWNEAEVEHLEVIEQDGSGFYGMWSGMRLRAVREALVGRCGPAPLPSDVKPAPQRVKAPSDRAADGRATGSKSPRHQSRRPAWTHGSKPAHTMAERPGAVPPRKARTGPAGISGSELVHQSRDERLVYASLGSVGGKGQASPSEYLERQHPTPQLGDASAQQLARKLEPVAKAWGDAFPWFVRAVDLLRLGDRDAAADELHNAYLAWRRARGKPIRFAGLESIYRGDARRPGKSGWSNQPRRRNLGKQAKKTLTEVAHALGEVGVALGFEHWRDRLEQRPRAYTEIVYEKASKYGIDPNLLFAVMRVESVYQKRVVSYAGAVGLMQIMPHTGARIADQLGYDDFDTSDLLSPEVNLEFAAWYLSSLLERFDGRLPLAIASYNGGPHNVRQWMRKRPEDMPLDVFLEHIPFSQTHRYVRRVLTHYAQYRKQQGLPMPRLSLVLPTPSKDSVSF